MSGPRAWVAGAVSGGARSRSCRSGRDARFEDTKLERIDITTGELGPAPRRCGRTAAGRRACCFGAAPETM